MGGRKEGEERKGRGCRWVRGEGRTRLRESYGEEARKERVWGDEEREENGE